MSDARVERLTGVSGVLIGVGAVALVPLYFMYAGPPPAWNVLTRNFINLLVIGLFIVFISGFCHLVRESVGRGAAAHGWVASLAFAAGVTFAAMALVAISMETGGVFGAPNGTIDPTIDGPLADGSILLHGSVGRMLNALFLSAAGYAILGSEMLPAWLGRTAYGIALVDLAFIPSLYFGKDAAQFYSAIGWGNSAFAASLIGFWMFAAGVVLLRRPRLIA
jgi:hypothetical protein